ncbi:hypothetical protein WAZ07_23375 [Bacillus sp. FJAT-51639]|uniref:Uncharacterized protein n=1 Tax=Bacillus bruguierae TaxID=3127667 RepID=A0ABU8FQY6_9BACI
MAIIMSIYTNENISSDIYAKIFFDTIQEIGLGFTKISPHEPINKEFTIEKAIEMWTLTEPGCYDDELDALIGTAGGLHGKGKGFSCMVNWWESPKEKSISYLLVSFQTKIFTRYKDEIMIAF